MSLSSDSFTGTIFENKDSRALADVLTHLDGGVRYNLRTGANEIRLSEPFGSGAWVAFNDRRTCWLRQYIGENYCYRLGNGGVTALRFGVDSFVDAVNVLTATREVDPFAEWLAELPFWDGTPRIDSLLTALFGAADAPVVRWASRYLTLGAVQRTLAPGCKLDEMPILIAPQGRGKSALLAELLPPEHRAAWFSDTLQFDDRAKERAESLLGRVIVEAAELAGVTRASLSSLKAFLTRQNDGSIRLAYRRDPEILLRRCVIIGSVDRSECLPNDPSGLRRFVPVVLPASCHVEQALPPIREQLWAEALHRYQKGERANLPRDLISQAAAVAEEHRTSDTNLEDAIAAADLSDPDGLTVGRIGEILGLVSAGEGTRLTRAQEMRIATGLTHAGYTKSRTRRDGRQITVWTSPEATLGFGDGASDGF